MMTQNAFALPAFAPAKPRAVLLALAFGVSALTLAGCTEQSAIATAPPVVGDAATPVVTPAVVAPPPPPNARTADQFDTTTAEQRAAAVVRPAEATSTRLGTTIASLGPPAQAGLWMSTGLVDSVQMGRVEYPAKGTSVALELRPSGAAATAGSQISLAALRLLEAPLTGLPELVVFSE